MSILEQVRSDFLKSSVRGFAIGGLLLVAEAAAAGPTFVVNSLADLPAGPNRTDQICETATGNGICTLRAAIMEANATRDAIVRVPAGFYALTRVSTETQNPSDGDLDVFSPMKIEGDGPGVSIIDASALSRVFHVELALSTDLAEIRGMTIQNGLAANASGGGIESYSRLVLENTQVSGNSSARSGGGVYTGAALTIRHSIVKGNDSSLDGGGISFESGYLLTIEDSVVEDNESDRGGGLSVTGLARVERTVIARNTATFEGGGIYLRGGSVGLPPIGRLTAVNSAIFQNSSSSGSGIFVGGLEGTTELIHVTITDNGPINRSVLQNYSNSPVSLRRSIVTSNNGGGCFGPILSGDYNIIESPTSCPMTGAVAHNISVGGAGGFDLSSFNGGFSRDVSSAFTVAAGAVPAGACLDELGAPLTSDFRGHRRPSTTCDIGAHDSGAFYKPAQLIGVNLLRNGGKAGQELGLANTTLAEDMQPPYWQQAGVVLHRLYGPGFPSLNATPPGNGHKFLSGWLQNATANQTIDVSALSAQIDAGGVAYQIGGSFGGKSTDNDNAAMTILFYSDGFGFLDAFNLGGFTAADRGNQTKLMRAQRIGTLPVGTRLIQVGVSFTRTDGFTNEAFADGLSVTLPEPGLASGLGTALIVLAGLARRRRTLDA